MLGRCTVRHAHRDSMLTFDSTKQSQLGWWQYFDLTVARDEEWTCHCNEKHKCVYVLWQSTNCVDMLHFTLGVVGAWGEIKALENRRSHLSASRNVLTEHPSKRWLWTSRPLTDWQHHTGNIYWIILWFHGSKTFSSAQTFISSFTYVILNLHTIAGSILKLKQMI